MKTEIKEEYIWNGFKNFDGVLHNGYGLTMTR